MIVCIVVHIKVYTVYYVSVGSGARSSKRSGDSLPHGSFETQRASAAQRTQAAGSGDLGFRA